MTAFELMTGSVPWPGGDPEASELRSMYEICNVGECSEKMHRFITKALTLEPTLRFTSAADMRVCAKDTQFAAAGLNYDAFISYRVNTDADTAQSVFKLL